MDNLSDDPNCEERSSSSASSTTELATNHRDDSHTVCINPVTHGNTDGNDPGGDPEPSNPLDRENYGVLGRSMEDMQRSVVTSQQPPPPTSPPAAATQGNATTPQQSADNAQILPRMGVHSSSTSTAANANNIVPLRSQHSNESTANSTNSGSVYIPAPSQANRPQLLMNFNQHAQASPISAPPPPTNHSAVQHPSRMDSTDSNTSHTSRSSDGRVSNAATPAGLPFSENGTPSSPTVDLRVSALYTASQTSLQYDGSGHGLPLNRSSYMAVGCSQEDVQRPRQCTQVGQVSGNTNSSAAGAPYIGTSSTASTSQQQYGSTIGYTGGTTSTNSTPQQQYQSGNPPSLGASPSMASHSGMILYSQHSNDSTGSAGSSSIPDNSISAHAFHCQPTRRQSLTITSSPFVHDQTTGMNYMYSGQPPALNRMDSNTSQNSGASVHTPTDHSSPFYFPSIPQQGSICPPLSHVTLSATQHATNTT